MQALMVILIGGLGLLPLMGGTAVLIIVILTYKVKIMGKQFAECAIRKGVVNDMGIREPTQLRPYRHYIVKYSFQNSSDLVEIPCYSGDLKQTQVGDEIPLYFYPNGTVTVVAYDEGKVKKQLGQQVMIILVLCVVLSLFIPTVGLILMILTR